MEAAVADDLANGQFDASAPFPSLGAIVSGGVGGIGGTLETVGDLDSFRFSLTAGVTYKFRLEGFDSISGSLTDPNLQIARIRDSFPVATDDDSGVGRDSLIIFMPQETIDYFATVSGKGNIGTWQFHVIGLDPFDGAAETTFLFMTNQPLESNATLADFAQTQFTFSQQIGVLSPTVAMYEALGLALSEISPALKGTLSPGNASDSDFVSVIYGAVFGIQPSAAQVQVFLSQLDSFESIYLASGAFGQDTTRIETLARGAVIGQMLGVNADIAASNAAAATGNLINGNGIATVGTSAAMDFDLL